ncbi:MAG: hypothetical protein ACM37W_18340 [Actinomycetota bacterium]
MLITWLKLIALLPLTILLWIGPFALKLPKWVQGLSLISSLGTSVLLIETSTTLKVTDKLEQAERDKNCES